MHGEVLTSINWGKDGFLGNQRFHPQSFEECRITKQVKGTYREVSLPQGVCGGACGKYTGPKVCSGVLISTTRRVQVILSGCRQDSGTEFRQDAQL